MKEGVCDRRGRGQGVSWWFRLFLFGFVGLFVFLLVFLVVDVVFCLFGVWGFCLFVSPGLSSFVAGR